MADHNAPVEPAAGSEREGVRAAGLGETSTGASDASPRPLPFSRYIHGMKTGKLRIEAGERVLSRYAIPTPALLPPDKSPRKRTSWVQEIPVGPPGTRTHRPGGGLLEGEVPGEARAPFQRYIKGIRQGMDSVAEPSPSGSRYTLSSRTRMTVLLGMMALVLAGVWFLTYYGQKVEKDPTPTIGLAAPSKVVGPKPEAAPVPLGPVFVEAYQYVDAADTRPAAARKDSLVESGDYLTLVARGRQRKWLYFVVLGSNDQFRLSKIYSPELVIRQIPPLKIRIMDKVPGKVQGLVIASRDELPRLNNWVWDANYRQFEPRELKKSTARERRLQQVLSQLKKEVPAEKWAYKLLPELNYQP